MNDSSWTGSLLWWKTVWLMSKLDSDPGNHVPIRSLTWQYIEDGFDNIYPTGVVFVDLSAAYENHRRLFYTTSPRISTWWKWYGHFSRTDVSMWSWAINGADGVNKQWNGLPQGSVLAPLLFLIYTNDQPIFPGTRIFAYADDLAVAAQHKEFSEIEVTLSATLNNLTTYYEKNQLRVNPAKTQTCLFHLQHGQANGDGVQLEHCAAPVYISVTLDRTLSYQQHAVKLQGKLHTRNSLLRKLSNSTWGADTTTVRTTDCSCFVLLPRMGKVGTCKESRYYSQRKLSLYHRLYSIDEHRQPVHSCWNRTTSDQTSSCKQKRMQ